MQFTSSSEEETRAWAKQLVQGYFSHLSDTALVFALVGEMGTGKTQFAKGVAEALEVPHIVNSPTYVLVKEYEGTLGKLIHIDCWRTPNITAEELHLDTYLKEENVVVIEWPQPLLENLQNRSDISLILLEFTHDGGVRQIKHV